MGRKKTFWSLCVIVAAGIGLWLFSGDTTTLADETDPCLDLCLPPDCNGNGVTDACDIDCGNSGPMCIGSDCFILTCITHLSCGTSTDCNSNGIPDECDPDCDGNGIPDDCESACCLAGVCSNLDATCCAAQGGTFRGQGTSCSSTQACCDSDNLCSDVDPECCDAQGGIPAGPGTSCSDFGGGICSDAWGCCNPNHSGDLFCPNHTIYDCVIADEGDPLLGVVCVFGADGDGDGVHDLCDACPSSNPDDADGDGVCDDIDNCLGVYNPNQEDCTGDGVGDACEPDCDGDTIPDACDNEPDCDADGIPDDCDPDIDGDGVLNADDLCDYTPFDDIPPGMSINADGTLPGDLDGDCDVDANDLAILNSFTTGSGTCPENNDTNHTDGCCSHCGQRGFPS